MRRVRQVPSVRIGCRQRCARILQAHAHRPSTRRTAAAVHRSAPRRAPGAPGAPVAPVLDPSIPQFFAPGDGAHWTPALVGAARITYTDAKLGIDETRDVVITTPIVDGPVPVDWEHGEPAGFEVRELQKQPPHTASFDPLPPAASVARKYAQWSKDFSRLDRRSRRRSSCSRARAPGSCRSRTNRSATSVSGCRRRSANSATRKWPRSASATPRASTRSAIELRRAESAVAREQEQATESKLQTGVSVAATIFGALLGRKAISASTLGRATTAARSVSRIGRASQDVARAESDLGVVRDKHEELTAALNEELQAVGAKWDASDDTLDRVVVKPKRGGVAVQLVALVWLPR